ncbi:hypothetical protein Q8A73_022076 [Channa argus]|nr:hypothetical protein Q8A73_022076 [Channa argus]
MTCGPKGKVKAIGKEEKDIQATLLSNQDPHLEKRGLRCGRRFSPAAGHRRDRGGFLRLPRLVRTEAERPAVMDPWIVSLSLPVTIYRINTSLCDNILAQCLCRSN